MGVLHHKLRRDLLSSTGTVLTVVAIIAVGTGCFVGFGSAQRILESSQAAYYRQYRMADFWIDVKKVPLAVVQQHAAVDHRADANLRPLQILQNRHWPPLPRRFFSDVLEDAAVILVAAVREVEPCHVNAGGNQRGNGLAVGRRRTDGRNNLRATSHVDFGF